MKMDEFGDRMKMYECQEAGRRFTPLLPIYARIDGRNFSTFTRPMKRPFDADLHGCMVAVTKRLVENTGALVGYTQSDEISLLWYSAEIKSQVFFDGKIFKVVSVSAALATSYFIEEASPFWPDRLSGLSFDCRAFQLPTKDEAANAFLWREMDATKNAVSMAARTMYSAKQLHGKGRADMQEMMFQKGVNFNDYPAAFKRGTFVLRRTVVKELEPEILAKIPPEKRPTGPIERQVVGPVEMPIFKTVTNRVAVLFDNAEPETAAITPPPAPRR